MKLWLLRPCKEYEDGTGPWIDKWDVTFGFVIRAETEKRAREPADSDAGDENRRGRTPWLNDWDSTCIELTPTNKEGIVIRDFNAS